MKLLSVLLLLLVGCNMSAIAFAKNVSSVDVCYEEWRPYAFKDEKGDFHGVTINKLRNRAEQLGITLTFFELPFSRCAIGTKGGIYDVALFVDDTDELTLIPKPIAYWDIAVVTHKDKPLLSKNAFENPNIKRVLLGRDYIYPAAMLEQLDSLEKVLVTASYYIRGDRDIPRVFSYLMAGQVDAMLIDKAWAEQVMPYYKLPLVSSSWLLYQQPQYAGYGSLGKSKLAVIIKLFE
ncbi:hypothetical protein [Thalassotalea ganghwensis]